MSGDVSGPRRTASAAPGRATFFLDPAPPFRLDLTAWALRRRAHNTLDRWDGRTYRRALLVGDEPIDVAVTQTAPPDAPRLQVAVTGTRLAPGVEAAVTVALERLLGLRIDLAEFYRLAAGDEQLGPLALRFRGFKPPRLPSLFEALINAIACQQVTLTQGIHLLNRLAETFGPSVPGPAAPAHAFPRAEDLAALDPERLRAQGWSRRRAQVVGELAAADAEGRLGLDEIAGLDDQAAVDRLCRLRGVGRWTAEYVLLRGLGRLHIFPGDDVGAQNNLRRWLGLDDPLDYHGVRRTVARWQPYAGLVYFHLLLEWLAERERLAV